jgi:hypothetical protein
MGWAQDVHTPGWRTWVRAHQELLLSVALLALAGTLFVDEPFAGAVPPALTTRATTTMPP